MYSVLSKLEILKTSERTLAVETRTSRTPVAVSRRADGGVFGGQSGGVEEFSSGGEVERGASFLEDHVGAAFDPGAKTPRSQEQLATSMTQQGRLHAK